MDIQTLCELFCDHSTYDLGFAPDTIRRYRSTIKFLQRRTGVNQIDECTEAVLRDFFHRGRSEHDWSASSFVTFHKSLLVFFRWCVGRGDLAVNPVENIALPKAAKTLPRGLSKEKALGLLETAENYPYDYTFLRFRNPAILAMAIFAGLRKRELLQLQMTDVDVEGRSVFVRRGKGAKDRVIPMHPRLGGILRSYQAERRRLGKTCPQFFTSLNRDMGLTDTGLRRLVRVVGKAGRQKFTMHMLRHTFATLMLEGGSNLFAISQMMGHSEITSTTIYLAASPEHLRAQIAKHPLGYI